jgi:hypothetical protein
LPSGAGERERERIVEDPRPPMQKPVLAAGDRGDLRGPAGLGGLHLAVTIS